MRRRCDSHRLAVPVAERAATGVVLCVLVQDRQKVVYNRHKEDYDDETRHPSTSGTDGRAGC